MKRPPEFFSRAIISDSRKHSAYPILLVVLLIGALLCAAGCKKTSRGTTSQIRPITREFISAARDATGGRADVDTHPEYAPSQAGKPQTLIADQIYITVPLTRSGLPDLTAHDAIEAGLGRVAESHHLHRVSRPGLPGVERFDYTLNGRRTQSVHLITPLTKPQAAAPATAQAEPEHAKPAADQPRLAIVIDDLGSDRAQAEALFRLSFPLTLSVMPHLDDSSEIAEEAHRRGYEVMLHLPMASIGGQNDEPVELRPGMDLKTVRQTVTGMLDTVPYASGVNNHEGSLGTSDRALMNELMPLLRERKLFFVDSRTAVTTVAETAAHSAGVPAASRNVFLDDQNSAGPIRKQFALAVRDAREKGAALAIGHPRPETLQVLADVLPQIERQGITLVFASDLVH